MIRVAINGFGRIGRSVFRILDKRTDINVVAINDLSNKESIAYLLKYDTVMGPFVGNVEIKGDKLLSPNQEVQIISEANPSQLPWEKNKIGGNRMSYKKP